VQKIDNLIQELLNKGFERDIESLSTELSTGTVYKIITLYSRTT